MKLAGLSSTQIKNVLLMCDIGGRFDGDLEVLNFFFSDEKTFEEAEHIRALLRNSGVPVGLRMCVD